MNATAETPFRPAPARPRTVLVLGGGGMKGTAHVGVWKAVEEAGIRPDAIIGCSIGSLIATSIAGGLGWRELADVARGLRKEDIVQINRRAVWMGGVREESVFDGATYRNWIARTLPLKNFADAQIPVRVNAVSLVNCGEVWFGSGLDEEVSPADAVYASCAIPIYYPPLRLNGDVLVDGGVLDTLPVKQAFEWGADRVIAVDVGAEIQPPAADYFERGMIAIHERVLAMNIAGQRQRALETWKDKPVVMIRPRIGHLGTWDFARTQYFLEEGYRAAREALKTFDAEDAA
ncbi:MAG TPA: patatin-like phospholipase family protein [Longimicrobium sp.]|nr:patatin-like phospholipase family protein [Longimicrobium sp.]